MINTDPTNQGGRPCAPASTPDTAPTELVLARLTEIRGYIRSDELGAADQLARDTLESYPLAGHTRSWVDAARKTIYWCCGPARRRYTELASNCIDCAIEGISDLGVTVE